MTFSLTVFVAMILLLPGFGLFGGIFAPIGSAVRAAPPPPASFAALTIVIGGACTGHLVGMMASAVLGRIGAATGIALLPRPYALLVDLSADRATSEGGLLSFLLMVLAVTITLAVLSRWAMVRDANHVDDAKRGRLAGPFYGWLRGIVAKAHPANRYVNAFVLCDMESGDGWLGYEGTLDSLTLSSDKEIVSILLKDANSFRISIGSDGERKRAVFDALPIERLHIAKDRIVNVAFEIYEVADA